jgi:hypothetical protein
VNETVPVEQLVIKMRMSGIPRAQALHEALGFKAFDRSYADKPLPTLTKNQLKKAQVPKHGPNCPESD